MKTDDVAEWLRRQIANLLLIERESSNLSVVEMNFVHKLAAGNTNTSGMKRDILTDRCIIQSSGTWHHVQEHNEDDEIISF